MGHYTFTWSSLAIEGTSTVRIIPKVVPRSNPFKLRNNLRQNPTPPTTQQPGFSNNRPQPQPRVPQPRQEMPLPTSQGPVFNTPSAAGTLNPPTQGWQQQGPPTAATPPAEGAAATSPPSQQGSSSTRQRTRNTRRVRPFNEQEGNGGVGGGADSYDDDSDDSATHAAGAAAGGPADSKKVHLAAVTNPGFLVPTGGSELGEPGLGERWQQQQQQRGGKGMPSCCLGMHTCGYALRACCPSGLLGCGGHTCSALHGACIHIIHRAPAPGVHHHISDCSDEIPDVAIATSNTECVQPAQQQFPT